jgi:integrase
LQVEWADIDIGARLWTVPAHKIKMKRPHKVPIPSQAMTILEQACDMFGGNGYVFPGGNKGSSLSDRVLEAIIHRQMHVPYAVHGFRASFSTWANETQGFAFEDVEACLAHQVGNAVSRAYDRAERITKRAIILQSWADFVTGVTAASNVIPLQVAGRSAI